MNMATKWEYVFNINPDFNSKTSLDFLNYFIPLLTRGDYLFEAVLYIGFVPLLLCLYCFKDRPLFRRELLLLGLFGFVTALGPYLIINQRADILLYKYALPMPQMLFARLIPFFGKMSRPFRFIVLFNLLLSVYAALGFRKLLDHLGIKNRGAGLAAAVAVFAIYSFEFKMIYPAAFQVKYQEMAVPELFKTLGRDKSVYSIMLVPDLRPPWEDQRMKINFFIPLSKPDKVILDRHTAYNLPKVHSYYPDQPGSYIYMDFFTNAAKFSQIYQALYHKKKVSGMKSMPLFYERLSDREAIGREIANIRDNDIRYIVFFTTTQYEIGLKELGNFSYNIRGFDDFRLLTSEKGLTIYSVAKKN